MAHCVSRLEPGVIGPSGTEVCSVKWLCEVASPQGQNLAQQVESFMGFRISIGRARWHGLYPRSFPTASRYFKRLMSSLCLAKTKRGLFRSPRCSR